MIEYKKAIQTVKERLNMTKAIDITGKKFNLLGELIRKIIIMVLMMKLTQMKKKKKKKVMKLRKKSRPKLTN